MTIAVVIPFFQRKPGLLERAILSVRAQRDIAGAHIVVVDDASPVPASDEVSRVGSTTRFPIEVIRKPNGGPASARNRGLDTLRPEVKRVAFLDSDDVWKEDHLIHATCALDAGHDFYFADHYQPGQEVSAFNRAGRIVVAEHPRIGSTGTLHSYVGAMFDQIIMGNIIGTSTVVYDFERFKTQRFDEAFFSAGEDYLFWIACARAGARFCFSSDVEVQYGYGVNVYSGSGWGTEGFLARVQNEMRYRKRLLAFDLSREQRRFVNERIATLRVEFADDILHRLNHRTPLPMQVLWDQLTLDPMTLLALPVNAGHLVARRIKQRKVS